MKKKNSEALIVILILVGAYYLGQGHGQLPYQDFFAVTGQQTMILAPVADVSVDESMPSYNWGNSEYGWITSQSPSGNRRIALKFDLSSLTPEIFDSISEAKVGLQCNYVGDRNYDIYLISSTWTETSITWSTQPTLGTLINTQYTGSPNCLVKQGGLCYYLEKKYFSVTDAVKALKNSPTKQIAFVIKDSIEYVTPFRNSDCNPTENAGEDPELLITISSVPSCTPNWSCTGWSECGEGGTQVRTCTDLNACGVVTGKPAESQTCTVQCTPSWLCSEWSACTGGIQTRTCYDQNSCGTSNPNPTTQSCTIPGGFDWTQYWWVLLPVGGFALYLALKKK